MEEVLQIAEERREAKGKGERERYTQHPTECRVPENSKEREEGLKRTTHIHRHTHTHTHTKRKTIEWERLEITSKKLEIPRKLFKDEHN